MEDDPYTRNLRRLDDTARRELNVRLDRHDQRLERIETRMNYLFGGLGVVIALVNVVLPFLVREWP